MALKFLCHANKMATNKVEPRKANYHNHLQTRLVLHGDEVGAVVGVVVVIIINAPYFSLSLKIKPKKVKYKRTTTLNYASYCG